MNLHTRISAALHMGQLRAGGLFVVDVSYGTDLECERERVYLTSDIEQGAMARLSGSAERAFVSSELLGVADDWCAWVLSYRAAGLTHRVVVPLFGEEVARLIECASQGDVFLVFTSAQDDDLAVESQLHVSRAERGLLQKHWRPHLSAASPDRLLQTLDILMSTAPGSGKQLDSLTLVVPADLQVALSKLMPAFNFD